MIKPGDKVHVEFDVDSVDNNGFVTLSRGGSGANPHVIAPYRNHIVKSWTPIREPQVGDVYVRTSSGFLWTIVHIDGDFAWVKDQANKSQIWPLSNFQSDILQLSSEAR